MSFVKSEDASIGAHTQEYPDSEPVVVPPRPARTGADTRVSQTIGAYTQMDEEELKESKEYQRHAYKDDTALFPWDEKEPIYRVGGYKTKGHFTYKPEDPLKNAELMAVEMRRSRKRDLIASKRTLRNAQDN